MARYRLHCVGASGNSFKVALFLNCAGLDWEPVGLDFAGGETRDQDWRAATNVMGEVPVLEVDGRHMSQSGAILVWLAETHGVFGPAGAEETFETMRWLLFDNHKFTGSFAQHRIHQLVHAGAGASRRACLLEVEDRERLLDRRPPSLRPQLHAGRPADDRGFLTVGLSVLSDRGDRIRSGRDFPGDRCLARARRGTAGLEAAL